MNNIANYKQLPKNYNVPIILVTVDEKEIDRLIGGNLLRMRKSRGLTQGQLAEMIGAEKGKISAYEHGHAGIGKDILSRICNALKVQPWEFYVTEDAPLIIDQAEKDVMQTFREARPLGCAEEIAKYGKFIVRDAKDMQKRMKKK